MGLSDHLKAIEEDAAGYAVATAEEALRSLEMG